MKHYKTFCLQEKKTKKWNKRVRKRFSDATRINENISFNHYLTVLMLVITKMQINYLNIRTTLPHSYYFFFEFSFNSCLFIFLCLHFVWQTEQYHMLHLLVSLRMMHWQLFCKTTFRQKITKIVKIF